MTPKELRLAHIEATEAEATRLLAIVTTQPMKDRIARAQRDIAEARVWLERVKPANLAIVAAATNLADAELAFVAKAVEIYGADVTEIGG